MLACFGSLELNLDYFSVAADCPCAYVCDGQALFAKYDRDKDQLLSQIEANSQLKSRLTTLQNLVALQFKSRDKKRSALRS